MQCCAPDCLNNSETRPEKVIFNIPKQKFRREQWSTALGLNETLPNSHNSKNFKKKIGCCEDHFNLYSDCTNFAMYSVMEGKGVRLTLNPDAVPKNKSKRAKLVKDEDQEKDSTSSPKVSTAVPISVVKRDACCQAIIKSKIRSVRTQTILKTAHQAIQTNTTLSTVLSKLPSSSKSGSSIWEISAESFYVPSDSSDQDSYETNNDDDSKSQLIQEITIGKIEKESNGSLSLNVIVKADVNGTLEAILESLDTYESPNCELDIVHYGVGPVTKSEIELAKTFKCIIYSFNTEVPQDIKTLIDEEKIELRLHNVIYRLISDIKNEINKRLPSREVEDILGKAEVLEEIEISKGRKKIPIAGSICTEGIIKKDALFRVERNGQVIFEGSATSLRHLKNEVDLVKEDTECGIQLSNTELKFEKGDIIICVEKKTIQQHTDWDPGF